MDTKCPHCGTVYEVSDSDAGAMVTCETCHKEFSIEKWRPGGSGKRRVVVPPRRTKTKGNPFVRAAISDHADVTFVAPTIAKILEWIGYIGSLIYAGISCCVSITAMEDDVSRGGLALLVTLMIFFTLILSVRLIYEGYMALFEITRHLREIRDTIESRWM